MNLLVGFAFTR